jgi:hypothetical protein
VERLLRILLNTATIVSILLCVAATALWIRSYWGDGASFKLAGREWTWASRNGQFSMNDAVHLFVQELKADGIDPTRALVGQTMTFRGPSSQPMHKVTQIIVNYPLTAVATFLLSLWRTCSHWRRKQSNEGVPCAQCGYDLRATPDRCPECGQIPESLENLHSP